MVFAWHEIPSAQFYPVVLYLVGECLRPEEMGFLVENKALRAVDERFTVECLLHKLYISCVECRP